jgi:hypothetical protein
MLFVEMKISNFFKQLINLCQNYQGIIVHSNFKIFIQSQP